MIEGGAISVKGEKISATDLVLSTSDFDNESLLLKKGKKNFIKVVLK